MPRSSPAAKSSSPSTRKRTATPATAAKKPAVSKVAPAVAKKVEEPAAAPVPAAPVETLSLIDGPKPRKPRAASVAKDKPVFTPISGLKAPAAKAAPKKAEPAPAVPKAAVLDLISTASEKEALVVAEMPVAEEIAVAPEVVATDVPPAEKVRWSPRAMCKVCWRL